MEYQLFQNDTYTFCHDKKIKKYKLWVYIDGDNEPLVFYDYKPNTECIYFSFYSFSYYYWKLIQGQCIYKINNEFFYNFHKLKLFMINYLLFDTNVPGVIIERKQDGRLTENSLNSVLSIHPRILRVLFDKINLFPQELSKEEKEDIEKQCLQLFGKGKSIMNPHPQIVTYCNLISFWEKFGLNYHDVMKMPYELFLSLKKIMSLDNEYKSQSINKTSSKSNGVNF